MTSRVPCLFAAWFVVLVGCGGTVVFVEDDDGSGANGPGSGPGSGPGAGPGDSCAALCAIAGACLEGTDCSSTCLALYVDGCEAEADALVACLAENLGPDCNPGFGCNSQLASYGICAGGSSSGGPDDGPGGPPGGGPGDPGSPDDPDDHEG